MVDSIADWRLRGSKVCATRVEPLLAPCPRTELTRLLLDEQGSVAFCWRKGGLEARHHHRAEFRLRYRKEICDTFFNGVSGVRARYYTSVQHGQSLTSYLIGRLTDSLISKVRHQITSSGTTMERVARSLSLPSAKIWIDEDASNLDRGRVDAEALIAIEVPRWVKAAKQASAAFASGGHPRPSVKEKALLGVQVPESEGIAVFGAWLNDDSAAEFLVPSKRNRARHIRIYGFS